MCLPILLYWLACSSPHDASPFQALADMQLMPGVPELCAYLDQKRIPRGLITRNVKTSVDWLHEHHLAPLHSLTGHTVACTTCYVTAWCQAA